MNKLRVIFPFFTAALTAALLLCNACSSGTSQSVTLSSDPTISAFSFAAQDSFPGLAKAVFIVDNHLETDTGDIYTADSLLFGTRLDSVIPRFTYTGAQTASTIIYTAEDTITFLGTDAVDFSHNPTLVYVISQDLSAEKWYRIWVNAHQVDPDLYVWRKTADGIYPTDGTEQKLVYTNQRCYLYVGNGISVTVYSSSDAAVWTQEGTPQGLPSTALVRNILQTDAGVFYARDGECFRSPDALSFSSVYTAEGFRFVNLLFAYNNLIWAIVEDESEDNLLRLAYSTDGTAWETDTQALPEGFPVSDYATVTFTSPSGRPRAMVMGGYSKTGEALNTRWSVEYDGVSYRWANLSIEQPSFGALTGVSLIHYHNHLFLFGGTDADDRTGDYPMLESYDEGLNWSVPDSLHNCLPDTYEARSRQSVVVDDEQNIIIVGGRSRTQIFSDAYTGHLNSINWE